MTRVALTDHGTMMGSYNFYKACKKEDVVPIIGVETYITDDLDDIPKETRTKDNYHLVMLAKNNIGYQNLLKLVSKAQLNNFYYKPRISKHNLTPANTEGIIALSACLGSNLNKRGGWDEASKAYTDIPKIKEIALWYKETFKDGYYLEIQDNDDPVGQQKVYNELLISMGKELNIPMVITSDAHYTTQADSKTHSMLMAMQFKKTIQDYEAAGEMKYGPWFFIRSPVQMLEAARKYNCEEAFWNTVTIGQSCNVEIVSDGFKFPVYDVESDPDYKEFLEFRHVD